MAERRIAWKRIILIFAMLGIIICLFVYMCNTKGYPVCKGIDVKINNLKVAKLITVDDVKKMIEHSKIAGKGKPLSDEVVTKTLKLVKSNSSVKNVVVYQTGDSILHVELEQRIPVVRIMTSSSSCYLDGTGVAFPVSKRYSCDVPLVTGKIKLPAGGKTLSDTVFARDLLSFTDFISNSPFWNAQIQQIDVDENKNVEFVICSDNHLIRLGQLHGYKKKLDNLFVFYKKLNPYYRGANNTPFAVLDLRFNKQIVAIKRN
jgi:cell division protein FtsQ